MTAELTVLKNLFENEGLTPEQIAEVQELDVMAVKSGLMMCSSDYRKACGKEDEKESLLNYTEDEARRARQRILTIGLTSEDEHVALKALTYVSEDKMGRKDIVKAVANNTFNVLQFNEVLNNAKAGAKRLTDKFKNVGSNRVIEA